jgi:hypothetical protein
MASIGIGSLIALVLSLLLASQLSISFAQVELPSLERLQLGGGTLEWGSTGEWHLENDSFDGNPFDLLATVEFVHEESGESVKTEMFYGGDNSWRFRFAAPRLGDWAFTTGSEDPELDGHIGDVTVIEGRPEAQGFLVAEGNKLVISVDNGRSKRGVLYNVYVADQQVFQSVSDLPASPDELIERVDTLLDETAANGLNSLFVPVNNSWFSFGTRAYDEHDSEDPDLFTFQVLDTIIQRAHARGLFVHIWAWGDERRRWTPKGVGGINGEADRRLQRYIAARLSPLPGWTMAYGFDLEEWVEPEQVLEWASYIKDRSGWPHLLTAREYGEDRGSIFTLDLGRLDIFSTDDRPEGGFYDLAASRLEAGLPVLFERRFVYRRDGVWDADTTRRAMWQFAIAGGPGSIWGIAFNDPTPYPNPEQFRIHREFWHERFLPELQPGGRSGDGYALATPDGKRWVFYQEGTDRVQLDLAGLDRPRRAVAVDAKGQSYREIDLGELAPGEHTWEAPHQSDWAVAIGFGD